MHCLCCPSYTAEHSELNHLGHEHVLAHFPQPFNRRAELTAMEHGSGSGFHRHLMCLDLGCHCPGQALTPWCRVGLCGQFDLLHKNCTLWAALHHGQLIQNVTSYNSVFADHSVHRDR